jgi:hypothetical protein
MLTLSKKQFGRGKEAPRMLTLPVEFSELTQTAD